MNGQKKMSAAATATLLQSCPTPCDPRDGSPPGSPVPGILQARTLEWVAISFSNTWKWKVKVKLLSGIRLLATLFTAAYQAPPSMGFSRQKYWSGVPLPSPEEDVRGQQMICQMINSGNAKDLVYFTPVMYSVQFSSVQSLSRVQLFVTPMGCSTPGLPVHQQLLEFTQTHVHWVGDAIQLSHPLLSPSHPTFNFSQHQGLFKWVSSSHQVAKVLEFQLQHQSFQWTLSTVFL